MKKLKDFYSEFETVDLSKVIGGDTQEADKTQKPKTPNPPPPPDPPWWKFWE